MSVGTGVLDELSTAVDRLASLDPAALGDHETVVALHRELERLAAVTTRAVAAFDAAGAWDDDARSAASWLAYRCRMAGGRPVPGLGGASGVRLAQPGSRRRRAAAALQRRHPAGGGGTRPQVLRPHL